MSGIALQAGKLLLVQRGRGLFAGHWSLPGGRIEPVEPHRSSLVREFREETGLEVVVDRLAGVAEDIDTQGRWHYLVVTYFVKITGGQPSAGDDAAALRWADREELSHLPLTPRLSRYLEEFRAWD